MADDAKSRWELAEDLAALLVTGAWLAALFLGFDYWWVLLVVGYVVVVGGIDQLGDYFESRAAGDETAARPDPVARLQERYVRGEIDEAEYERRLETLLREEEATPDLDGERELEL